MCRNGFFLTTFLALLITMAVLLLIEPVCAGEKSPPSPTVPADPEIREALDLRYHAGEDRQLLDVISPAKGKGHPVVLFVHGGSWSLGDKNLFGMYRGVGQFFARHGMVGVMVNYRLSPTVKHPEHVKDIARAFAWVRQNIQKHGGDPDRIYLAGHSAGGHLVALLATDPQYLKDPALKLQDRDRAAIRGVIAISGVYRIPTRDEYAAMADEMTEALLSLGGQSTPASMLIPSLVRTTKKFDLIKMVFGEDEKVRAQASPLNHVRKGLPPFLILHAEYEIPKLAPMAREFRDALVKAEVPVTFSPIEGHSHETMVFRLNRPDDPTARAVLSFIDGIEKQRKSP
jgi:acetyl esterase/lipase